MLVKRSYPRTKNALLLIQIAGDCVFAFLGLALGYWLRFKSPLRFIGLESSTVSFERYLPLLLIGTFFFASTYAYLNVYDARLLLRPHRAFMLLIKGTLFWFVAFLGTSLVLKFEPSVSRLFVAVSCITTLAAVGIWRILFHACLQRSSIRERIAQRVILIGWSPEAWQLVNAISTDKNHPYEIVGWISTTPNPSTDPRGCPHIGGLEDLERLLREEHVDIAIIADLALSTEQLLNLSDLCERLYVQFKIVTSFFRIFVSNLRLQTISGVPVLGVEELRITSPLSSLAKRLVDIAGGFVGLALSAPIVLALAILIRRESPGPVIYKQVRTGRHGRPFTIYKLRSMRLNAESAGAQWAVSGDPRRLRIGAFMRENNLDELPQFWNVLIGDMSLVGPRPERPELIEKFEKEIPHYNPRHAVRPGITGWAQVNGLRGNTSLVDRIKYDLYYIENWSIWFDFQVLVQTFTRNKNAY